MFDLVESLLYNIQYPFGENMDRTRPVGGLRDFRDSPESKFLFPFLFDFGLGLGTWTRLKLVNLIVTFRLPLLSIRNKFPILLMFSALQSTKFDSITCNTFNNS